MSEKNEENVLKNIILRLTFNPTKEIQISSSENIIHYEMKRMNERWTIQVEAVLVSMDSLSQIT